MHFNSEESSAGKLKLFEDKGELLAYVISCAIGITGALFSYRLLDQFPYNFGKNVAGVFIPPLIAIAYFTFTGLRYGLTNSVLLKTILLFCFLIIPYTPLLFQTFQPTGEDDFARYYLYAKNMFNNNTLWGGDSLFFEDVGKHYVTQPGYRYFIYFELLLFRDLYRFVSFLNAGLYVLAVFFFHRCVYNSFLSRKLQICLVVLTLLFSPYLIKNLLMGLPEWLTITLIMWMCYLYLVPKNRIMAAFLLGLIPFLRQNMLIAVLLLFVWILIKNKQKVVLAISFILPLLLPIYHNLYYANELRFFVDVFQLPFINYDDHHRTTGLNYALVFSNIIHYTGFDYGHGKFIFTPLAIIFLPFATAMFFIFIKILPTFKLKFFFFLTSMSAVVPIILFGNAYYPRFEVVNVAIMLAAYLIIWAHTVEKKNHALSLSSRLE
ncbi:hypothetical protein HRG84_14540 [Flavisolibacter sp. BT320]|nr:hypothetical protein [Flavisolibacter longurius]